MQQDVIFGILMTMLSRQKISARELAQKYEISTRTVYRYIDTLSAAGVPIYATSGKNGGISIIDNFKLDKTYFTEVEMTRLIGSVKSMATAFSDDLSSSIIDKLLALNNSRTELFILQSDQLLIDSSPWGMTRTKNKMTILERCIVNAEKLKIDYHSRKGEITARIIEPHALVLKEGIWYTYAYCHLREHFRLFKIGRMKNIMTIGENFVRRNTDISKSPYNTEWFSEENLIDIMLEVNAAARLDVEEWLGIEAVFPNKKGVAYAYAKVPNDIGLLSKLMSFGSNIKIIEPQKLIDDITAACQSISTLYLKS